MARSICHADKPSSIINLSSSVEAAKQRGSADEHAPLRGIAALQKYLPVLKQRHLVNPRV